MSRQEAIVKIQYGSYSGEVSVICSEDDEAEYIIARAFKQAECYFLSMASTSGKILSRNYID